MYGVGFSLMGNNKTVLSKNSREWGIPNWRNENEYSYLENASDLQWKWEFLRRRKDYREDWLKYSPQTHATCKALKVKLKKSGSLDAPYLFNYSPRLLTSNHFEFVAENPHALKKYGLKWMPHPANPHPSHLWKCWHQILVGLPEHHIGDWEVRNLGLDDHWGMEYSLFPNEIAFCLDLSKMSVDQQLRYLLAVTSTKGFERYYGKRNSPLNFIFKDSDKAAFSGYTFPKFPPRIVRDPSSKNLVHLIFNIALPPHEQVNDVKSSLREMQENLQGKKPKRRKREEAWPGYLRLLDARPEKGNTIDSLPTWQEIGEVVYSRTDNYNSAKAQAQNAYKKARNLMYDFPY